MDYHFTDFTQKEYEKIIEIASEKYDFVFFKEIAECGRHIIWRHDIDFSVDKALELAEIERNYNVKATYFVHLHNMFYNLMEQSSRDSIKKIIELGHDVALHFDPQFYNTVEEDKLCNYLEMEKELMENIFEVEVSVFSFHNPTKEILGKFTKQSYCGMINAYSELFRNEYEYCSDSNGYWRFKRLRTFLKTTDSKKLHILTHPGWWHEDVMSPRQRIQRCIDDRAETIGEMYDESLAEHNRINIE